MHSVDTSLSGRTLSKEPVSFLAECWAGNCLNMLVNQLIFKIAGGNTTLFLAYRQSGIINFLFLFYNSLRKWEHWEREVIGKLSVNSDQMFNLTLV